jgi:hypothetical protein
MTFEGTEINSSYPACADEVIVRCGRLIGWHEDEAKRWDTKGDEDG